MKKKPLILICAVSVILMLFSSVTVCAAQSAPDLTAKGSVCVTVNADGEAVSGAPFCAYLVANATDKDGTLAFEFTDSFSSFGGDISDVDTASELQKLAEYASQNNISSVSQTTDENGTLLFENLELGTYLIVQTSAVDGYSQCDPFLAVVPYYENEKWNYSADASPKVEVEKLVDITITKVWNDGKSADSHSSVKVRLQKDGDTVKTVTLSKDNNWSTVLEDMPQSDSYSVEEINIPSGYQPAYTSSSDGLSFTVTNNSTLIKTGQLIWPIPVLSATGLVFIIVGITAVRRSKNDA